MNSINTNLAALHTANTLNSHYGRLTASVERLSSGLRVDSGADDAAGLAIRELMRSDVAALNQGQRNANDAISMIQVADGALGIIDEKLIRMKELAEQAATGTYNSTQRLLIDSEFKAMAAEIDRIARATDFNGMKLLDGSLSGAHDGSGLKASGAMKIHFGSGNDSAEDYYYVSICDCGTKGLGLRENLRPAVAGEQRYEDVISWPPFTELNDDAFLGNYKEAMHGQDPFDIATLEQGQWYCGVTLLDGQKTGSQNTLLLIKAGTRNFVLNQIGSEYGTDADNDIQLFTRNGKHLAGRAPIPDYNDPKFNSDPDQPTNLAVNCAQIGFSMDQYDTAWLNPGVKNQDNGQTLNFTTYNGMLIGYSGDGPEEYDGISRYEVLAIDHVTEDLVVWLPGVLGAVFKYYSSEGGNADANEAPLLEDGEIISINTQEKAQKALVTIDNAIVAKDKIRAHLGALQNRLENTVSNLSIQAENLQASESRISDADIALEMMNFVRNQVLTQSAIAILGQANTYPHMLMQLLG